MFVLLCLYYIVPQMYINIIFYYNANENEKQNGNENENDNGNYNRNGNGTYKEPKETDMERNETGPESHIKGTLEEPYWNERSTE